MQYTSWTTFGHILGTVPVELQMKPALATEESRINTGVKWWARLGLNWSISYWIIEGILKTPQKLPSKLPSKALALVGWGWT